MWVYVHNGAPDGYNGDDFGNIGVAQGTTLKINLNNDSKSVSGVVSANNADTVRDSARIVCGDDIEISYVEDSAELYSTAMGLVNLGNPTLAPVAIGYDSLDGQMPGLLELS